MARQILITFASGAFPVAAGEDEETNPGLYGRALANWLADALRRDGRTIDEVYAEDYGWVFEIDDPRRAVHVACSNDEGVQDHWMVFLRCEGSLLARLLGRDVSTQVLDEMRAHVRRVLAEHPGVSDLREESP